jgi:hypothetical protein
MTHSSETSVTNLQDHMTSQLRRPQPTSVLKECVYDLPRLVKD